MKNDTNTFRAYGQDCTVEKPHKQAPCLQMRKLASCLSRPATGFLLAGLLSMFLVGCTQEDSRSKSGEETSMSISSLSMAGISTKSTTTIVTNGVSLGAFRLAANGYAAQSNVQYIYSTATPGWSTTSPIILNAAAATVCAYYPYGAAGITGSTDPTAVTLTSQKYDATQDLCYATNITTLSLSSPTAAFAMQHAFAQLTFTITRGSLFTGTGNITNIAIANAGVLSSGSFKITDGTFNSTTPGTVLFNPGIASIAYGTPVTTSVLMVPVTTAMTGNLDLIFTVDGKIFTSSLPVSTNGLTTLTAGNNYNINIQLGLTLQAASNCYIVAPGASTVIPVGIKGNGGNVAGTGLSATHTAASVGVVWQTTSGLVTWTNFDATSQTVIITAGPTSGNAVIAAYASDGTTILWSWHIWVTNYNPNTKLNGTTYSYTNTSGVTNVFMDRNLGATSVAAADVNTLGLLYQWGRKDPFVNAGSYNGGTDLSVTGTAITNTGGPTSVATAIANPTYFYYVGLSPNDWNSSPSDLLWGGASYGATKTIFDPCPAGWRVPSWNKTSISASPWIGLATYQASYWSTNGFQWTTTPGIGFWPAAGFRYPGSGPLAHVGDTGAYWSASPYSSYGYYFYFISSTVRPEINNYRAYGYSVRCVQEW
jgi:hypothetical protein